MQKLFSLTLVALSVMFLSSCGGSTQKEFAKVKPDKVSISGPLADYLEVVDNEYEVVDDWGGKLSIKLKAKAKAPEDLLDGKDLKIIASMLNESGTPVSGVEEFELDYSSRDKVKSLLKNGSGEEVVLLACLLTGYDDEKDADRIKKFSLSSTLADEEKTSTVATSITTPSTDETETTTSGNQDWDKIIQDYDEYVDKYIALLKKAQKGDASAMADYPDLLQKAQDIDTELKKAQDDNSLTPAQMKKMLKIQQKMMNAAIDMQ